MHVLIPPLHATQREGWIIHIFCYFAQCCDYSCVPVANLPKDVS